MGRFDKKIDVNILSALIRSELNLTSVKEYKFHPSRKWRFDLAIPDKMIAIELEGGVYTGGRHTRGSGYIKDCNKYNAATVLGWRLIRYTHIGHSFNDVLSDIKEIIK